MDAPRRIEQMALLLCYARKHYRLHGKRPNVRDVARWLGIEPDEVVMHVGTLSMAGDELNDPGLLIDVMVDGDEIDLFNDQSLGQAPLRFSVPEALALSVALRALETSRAEPYAEIARSAHAKLAAAFQEEEGREVDDLERRIAVQGDDQRIEERFRILTRGIEEKRAVDLLYCTQSREEFKQRRLQPYVVIQTLGYWYVAGHDGLSGEVRIFKVERIKQATLTDERFEVPATFDATRYRDAIVAPAGDCHARVRFLPPLARLMAEEWAARDTHVEENGTAILERDFASVDDLVAWTLRFGAAAEILQPEEARAKLVERYQAMAEAYK